MFTDVPSLNIVSFCDLRKKSLGRDSTFHSTQFCSYVTTLLILRKIFNVGSPNGERKLPGIPFRLPTKITKVKDRARFVGKSSQRVEPSIESLIPELSTSRVLLRFYIYRLYVEYVRRKFQINIPPSS